MDLIELTPIADSMVGLPGSGLSVEQRKVRWFAGLQGRAGREAGRHR